jgi:hypothetical protein
MDINWRAVGIGFAITIIIGLLSGFTIPTTDFTLPSLSWAITGLIGGASAGYIVGNGLTRGAVHGILGTTIGALVVIVILGVLGTLLLGLVGLSLFLVPLLLLGLYAIPGAIGGAIGALLKGTTTPEVRQPAGR